MKNWRRQFGPGVRRSACLARVRPGWVLRVLCCVAWACTVGLLPLRAAAEFDLIAASGDASPDQNGTLLTFTSPALGDSGHVAFLSTLLGTTGGGDDNMVLFRGTTAGLSVIVRRGDAISELETALDFFNNLPGVNAAGVVSHTVAVEVPPEEDEPPLMENVAFLGSGGPLTILPRAGTASPTGMNQFVSRSIPVINNGGATAYRANYAGMQPETGIYSRAADGTVTKRLMEDVPAPGGGLILSLSTSLPTLNNAGQIGFTASVDDGVFTRNSVMRLDGTTPVEFARDGDIASDGTTTILNILSGSAPINEQGDLAFSATYSQTGVSPRRGIFRAGDDGTFLLAANPLPDSAELATNLRVHGLGGNGQVAFSADLDEEADPVSAIYVADNDGVNRIALEDDLTLPGSDKFFRSFDIRSISMNDSGQLAFLADLSDTANGPSAGRGLYFYDPTDGLQEILRAGDAFAGGTVNSLGLSGTDHTILEPASQRQPPDLDFSGLNNAGQLAFVYSLAGGVAGVAVWSSPVEPVPGDYNGNGVVDAADYTVWRDRLDQMVTLTNENPAAMTPGEVDQEDYDFWVAHFGETAGGGAGSASAVGAAPSQAAVPEPSGALLLACGVCAGLIRRGRRR